MGGAEASDKMSAATSINIVYGTWLIMQEPWTIGAKIMSHEMPEKPALRAKT